MMVMVVRQTMMMLIKATIITFTVTFITAVQVKMFVTIILMVIIVFDQKKSQQFSVVYLFSSGAFGKKYQISYEDHLLPINRSLLGMRIFISHPC